MVEKTIDEKNIENFNNNGGMTMYTYKTTNDPASAKEAVLEKMKEVDSKYSLQEYTPAERKTLGLETKTYAEPSQDEIIEQAKSSLGIDKNAEVKDIENDFSSKFLSLSNKAQNALQDKNEDVVDIEASYQSSLKDAENSSIKQGISRSSIYNEVINEIEGGKGSQLDSVQKNYDTKISQLESEKSILQQQKDSALTSFDISYAVKLENKISSLQAQILKEQEAVQKYNNQVAEKEAEYQLQQEKAETTEKSRIDKANQELLEFINKNGYVQVNKIKQQEKYGIALDYLYGLSKSQALNELNSNTDYYERQLGSFYPSVYAKMLNRDK